MSVYNLAVVITCATMTPPANTAEKLKTHYDTAASAEVGGSARLGRGCSWCRGAGAAPLQNAQEKQPCRAAAQRLPACCSSCMLAPLPYIPLPSLASCPNRSRSQC